MAFVGRSDVKDPDAQQDQWERLARRRERLYAADAVRVVGGNIKNFLGISACRTH